MLSFSYALWHGYIFIAHTLLGHEYFWRENHNSLEHFLVDGEIMNCVTLSVRVSILFLWVYMNFDLGSMKLLST
jgi:hypothetical protein